MKTFTGLGNLQVVAVPPGRTVEDCIQQFQQSGLVEYAEPEYARRLFSVTPNDPYFPSQWALAKIQAPDAWGIRTDASKVIVAVIDTGVLYTHADLTNNIWTNPGEVAGNGVDDDGNGYKDDIHGIDATVDNYGPKPWAAGDPLDVVDHGTPVAGIIGAEGSNSVGVAGVCWKVKLMVVKVWKISSGQLVTTDSWDIEGVDYAIENGAQILNLSWGNNPSSLSMREVLTKARNRGVVVVAALGNENADNDLRTIANRTYPASYELDNIVSVGASAQDDTLWPGSNYGQTTCDLMAPGENIYSTVVSGGYDYLPPGTSFAAPHVSGVLALLKAQFPQDNYQGLINRLLASTDGSGQGVYAFAGKCVTGGRLNAFRALSTTSSAPPNDNYANASILAIPTGLSSIVGLGNNVGATPQSQEPAYGGHSVWWTWRAPANPSPDGYYLHTVGSGFDTVLAAYPEYGGQPYWSQIIGPNDNGPGGCGTSQLGFRPTPSATYFFLVDGVTSYQLGAVRLTLSQGAPSLRSELRIDETTLVRQRAQGQFQMRIIGPPNESVRIEASTVIMSVFTNSNPYPSPVYAWLTGWQQLNALTIPAQGYTDYVDNAASSPARFYRCRIAEAPPLPETFSCNTVGYVDRTVPPGWSMLSNPLVGQSFCIPDLFTGVPIGFKVDTWDDYSQAWLEDVYQGNGVWSGPDCMQVRQPPEFGCLVYNPQTTNLVVTFIGHVWQAYYEDAFPVSPAQCIRSMPVPDGGWLGRQLHFQAAEGTTLFKMVNGSYQSYRYISGVWLPFEPVIDVGDAFWLNTPAWVWKHYDQTWPNGGVY